MAQHCRLAGRQGLTESSPQMRNLPEAPVTRFGVPRRVVLACFLASASGCRSHTQTPVSTKTIPVESDAWPTQWLSIAAICEDPTPRNWTIVQDQQILGYSRGACLGKDNDGWHLLSQLSEDQTFDQIEYEIHLWLNDQQLPIQAQLQTPSSLTNFEWNSSGLQKKQGDALQHLAKTPVPTWILPGHAVFLREVMFQMGIGYEKEEHRTTHTVYVPEYKTVVSHTFDFGRGGTAQQPLQATATAGSFEFVQNPKNHMHLELTRGLDHEQRDIYLQVTLSSPLRVHFTGDGTLEYRRADDLEVTPVTIPTQSKDQGPSLGGELLRVRSKKNSKSGKMAALMFLSDSGSQNRYGFVEGTKIDMGSHEILDAIARSGIVVLRIDDRGTGSSKHGSTLNPGFLDIVDDDRRALNWFAEQAIVDPRRIYLIGHGEGALRALMIAQDPILAHRRRHDLAGLVLLAAPGRNMQEVALDQISHSLAGQSPDKIEETLSAARSEYRAALTDDDLSANNESKRRWMKELFAVNAVDLLSKLEIPIFAAQGGKDFQMDPVKDFEAIVQHLNQRSRTDNTHKLYPQLDHLFKLESGESTVNHYADASRRVENELINDVIAWLHTRR